MHDSGVILYSWIRKRIRNDRRTQFWLDTWVGDMPLKYQHKQESTIVDRWVDERWSWSWIRQFDGGALQMQFEDLLLHLRPFQQNFAEDDLAMPEGEIVAQRVTLGYHFVGLVNPQVSPPISLH